MPSTAALTQNTFAGATILPGLQVSPFGARISTIKIYTLGITSTNVITATSAAIDYTVSGLQSTADIPIALVPSTGTVGPAIGNMWVSAANTLDVKWTQNGTSTSGIPGLTAPGAAYTLITLSYEAQSSSTTT